ncbi:MAG: PAS domain S-box protein [Deltaproteobacteria bacterium]|nr:MAG: PAS domain S-box protein [Deltaproteobacteria bacterium]
MPYLKLPVNAYVRKGSNAVVDARRMDGRKVGVVLRNVADEILSARTDLRVVRYNSVHDALFHLLAGEVDAVAHLGPILFEEARRAHIEDKIALVEPALADSPRSFAVRKENAAIVRCLDAGLNGMIGTPGYRRIYLKWFGPPKSFWTGERIVAVNAGVLLLLLAAIGGWHYVTLLRVNRALAESRARFQSLVETTSDVVWEADRNATITYISPNVREIFGYEPGELIGKTAFAILAPEGVAGGRKILEEAVEGRKPFIGTQNVYIHKSGRRVMTEGSGVPYFGPGGDLIGFRGIHRDVTERNRLDEELRRSETERLSAQKYEAVGKLAAGMAHNINNLMTIVSGYGSLLLRKMEPFDPGRKDLHEILYAGDRAAMITAQLLAYSRQSILLAKVEAIDSLVLGLVPSLRDLLGDGIELAVRVETPGVAVRVDVRQFTAGIEELARNAKEAMPEGGQLEIATGVREPGGAGGNGVWSSAPGRYATVSVSDTGRGMDREALSHLFEPFYTTRGFGRGMGLPSVYGFVKQSSGFIKVASEPGRGTTVTICLPLVEKTATD